ncbi:hypothetical protein EDD95_3064 [Streptomyces sp. CEV 2-1]|nr:hypothetical protein EDD95_3064 [Streptomyces sp. CEV 2-1]
MSSITATWAEPAVDSGIDGGTDFHVTVFSSALAVTWVPHKVVGERRGCFVCELEATFRSL